MRPKSLDKSTYIDCSFVCYSAIIAIRTLGLGGAFGREPVFSRALAAVRSRRLEHA